MNQELLKYIKEQIYLGTSQEKIRHDLIASGGWDNSDIDQVFASINTNTAPSNFLSNQKVQEASILTFKSRFKKDLPVY